MSKITIPSKSTEVNYDLKSKIAKTELGVNALWCVQCGICTSSCPVAEFLKPHQVIKMALLGLESVIRSREIWLCAECYMCYERCPQDVKPTEVLIMLKNIAAEEGYIYPALKKLVNLVINNGRIYEITDFENEIRADLGLPPVPEVNVDEIRKIAETTGLDKRIGIRRIET
nr:4Fe-4S dicluster domain-containing protein [Candidatus Baldrarchaeota archaeon]